MLNDDIRQVWTMAAARSEVLYERRQGRVKLLLCRQLQVFYGNVQVLFDVDFEIDEGEIVALLGTNGAGKSTLLKAICGVVEADKGAVIFDGRDITHAPPNEIAAHGVTQVPGGQGVFPSLTVRENLRVAGWLERKDPTELEARTAQVLEQFPILAQRIDEPAANLSGGQQQMLALGMAFLARPRLLLIDELSLGLAPVVVEQLLPMVEAIRDAGHHRDPGRAVGEPGAHHRRDGLLHGEGRDPLPRAHQRAAGASRPVAFGLPRGRRRVCARRCRPVRRWGRSDRRRSRSGRGRPGRDARRHVDGRRGARRGG